MDGRFATQNGRSMPLPKLNEVTQQDLFSTSPSWKEYDREFSKLLEDKDLPLGVGANTSLYNQLKIPFQSEHAQPRTATGPPQQHQTLPTYGFALETPSEDFNEKVTNSYHFNAEMSHIASSPSLLHPVGTISETHPTEDYLSFKNTPAQDTSFFRANSSASGLLKPDKSGVGPLESYSDLYRPTSDRTQMPVTRHGEPFLSNSAFSQSHAPPYASRSANGLADELLQLNMSEQQSQTPGTYGPPQDGRFTPSNFVQHNHPQQNPPSALSDANTYLQQHRGSLSEMNPTTIAAIMNRSRSVSPGLLTAQNQNRLASMNAMQGGRMFPDGVRAGSNLAGPDSWNVDASVPSRKSTGSSFNPGFNNFQSVDTYPNVTGAHGFGLSTKHPGEFFTDKTTNGSQSSAHPAKADTGSFLLQSQQAAHPSTQQQQQQQQGSLANANGGAAAAYAAAYAAAAAAGLGGVGTLHQAHQQQQQALAAAQAAQLQAVQATAQVHALQQQQQQHQQHQHQLQQQFHAQNPQVLLPPGIQQQGMPSPTILACPPGASPEIFQAAYAAAYYAQQSRNALLYAQQHQVHPSQGEDSVYSQLASAGALLHPSVQNVAHLVNSQPGGNTSPRTDLASSDNPNSKNSANTGKDCLSLAGNSARGKNNRKGAARVSDHSDMLDGEGRIKFNTLEEAAGQVMALARDQHGCRFLQRKFDEGGSDAVAVIFTEILSHVVELMVDPFGNYLVQKLLECCSDDQRTRILRVLECLGGASDSPLDYPDSEMGNNTSSTATVASSLNQASLPKIIKVALNTHGTRAVQKLVETINSPEQVRIAIAALSPGVVLLIKDLNGNHVVQRCLQRLGPEESQFIYDAAGKHCVEIATHRHGCCVLQRCVDHATGGQRDRLIAEIASNALALSQDPFGNYVVQYVLELGITSASSSVMTQLKGQVPPLSLQKFSSNVIEKCLKLGGPELDREREVIVREVMESSLLPRLLQDPFGNYVVQSSLTIAKGALHADLVEKIKPHLAAIKSSPYGKRILARSHLFQKK